jgi:hypothetical protein
MSPRLEASGLPPDLVPLVSLCAVRLIPLGTSVTIWSIVPAHG